MSKVVKYLYGGHGDATTMCRRRIKRLKRKGLVVTVPNVFFLFECRYGCFEKLHVDINVMVDADKLLAVKQLDCSVHMSSGFKNYKVIKDTMFDYRNGCLVDKILPAILVFKTPREAIIGKMLSP